MKKICILHASNTKNIGSLMMVANYINYTNHYLNSNVEFFIDNEEIDGLQRTKDSVSESVKLFRLSDLGISLTASNKNKKLNKLIFYANSIFNFGRDLKKNGITEVVVLGGDDFSQYYGTKSVSIKLLRLFSMINSGLKVTLVGQTIGPFTFFQKFFAS